MVGDKELKLFDVVVFKPNKRNLIQKAISFFSGRYCHIGFLIPGAFLHSILQSFGYEKDLFLHKEEWFVFSSSIKQGGVYWEPFKTTLKKYGGTDIYRIEPFDLLDIFLLQGYIVGSLGKKYSIFQLCRVFLKLTFNISIKICLKKEMGGVVCSEFVGYGLQLIRKKINKEKIAYSTPDSIINDFPLKLVKSF